MGANAQTSVPTFTAGEILTAANMNISARTGIPVFADSTARDAAFGGTGEKTLAEGQYAYLESTNATQVYDGSSWTAVGASGLTLISATTIGTTVSSVAVSNVFSSTYENYKITINGGVASADAFLRIQLGATTTAYSGGHFSALYDTGAYSGLSINNQASFLYAGRGSINFLMLNVDVFSPNLAKFTSMNALQVNNSSGGYGMSVCEQQSATVFTGFTIIPSTGTLTGGTIRVYGYANS